MEKKFKDKVFEILKENRKAIYIGRVPDDTKRQFIELANSEFEGDFGFLLKFLLDNLQNTIKFEEVHARLDSLSNEIKELKGKRKDIKLISGKVIRR